jgi:hypothetical protein
MRVFLLIVAQRGLWSETALSCLSPRTYLLCSTSLGRVLLVVDGELGCTLAPLGLGNNIHHPGDMEAASNPGGLGYDRVN